MDMSLVHEKAASMKRVRKNPIRSYTSFIPTGRNFCYQVRRITAGWIANRLGYLLLFLLYSPYACHSCPDLAYPAVQYHFIEEADSTLVRVRAYSTSKDKHIVLDHASLEALNGLPAGRYHFIFFVEELQIAELDQVCSAGRIKGCEAQRLGPVAIPLLEFKKSGTQSWQVELVRNGLCPEVE